MRVRRIHVSIVATATVLAFLPVASAAVKNCPASATIKYVGSNVRNRPAGLRPTGARFPAVCSFPSITKALGKSVSGDTVIAFGETDKHPASFRHETFPLPIPAGVEVTTVDKPAVTGDTFKPSRYVIDYNGTTSGAAIDLPDGSSMSGFTVRNRRKAPSANLVTCSTGASDLAGMVLDGAPVTGKSIETGVRASGDCSPRIDSIEVRNFALDGVVLDNTGTVLLHDVDIHHNASDGLVILRSGSSPIDIQAERPTLDSLGRVHDNGRDGVVVGRADYPQDIGANIHDLDVFNNGRTGISIADQGVQTVNVDLTSDNVYSNGASGIVVHPSGITFSGSKFHNNTLNQVVFDGGDRNFTFGMDSGSGVNDASSNAIYCYTTKQVFGIFARNGSNVTVRHTEFEGGGSGLKDFGADGSSVISVSQNGAAIPVCP